MVKTPPPPLPVSSVDPTISIGTKAVQASAFDPSTAAPDPSVATLNDVAEAHARIQEQLESQQEQWEDFLRDYDEDSNNIRTQLSYISDEISSLSQQKRLVSSAIIAVCLSAGIMTGLIAGIAFYYFFR
ncbi:MAG: hypothetical protein AAF352_00180 [Pseudomonadota bacterium]